MQQTIYQNAYYVRNFVIQLYIYFQSDLSVRENSIVILDYPTQI